MFILTKIINIACYVSGKNGLEIIKQIHIDLTKGSKFLLLSEIFRLNLLYNSHLHSQQFQKVFINSIILILMLKILKLCKIKLYIILYLK